MPDDVLPTAVLPAEAPGLECPGCGGRMASRAVEGRYGRSLAVDHCRTCAAFWFDRTESLELSPRSVLELFALIHEVVPAPARRPLDRVGCPRCAAACRETTDLQRGTPFRYWRCPADHGRFIGHLDFLREKAFVRPLSPAELADLRDKLRTVACSGCGAPVDVAHDSACRFCRAPLSVLDATQVDRVLAELRRQDGERQRACDALPLSLLEDRLHVDRLFDRLERHQDGGTDLVRSAVEVVTRGLELG